jgi:hypothetical protein
MFTKKNRATLIASIAFLVFSPIGVWKMGGAYWLLFIPVVFGSLLFDKSDLADFWRLNRNSQFFFFVIPSFLLLRFFYQVKNYLGLGVHGGIWLFVMIAALNYFAVLRSWNFLELVLSPSLKNRRDITDNVAGTYFGVFWGLFGTLLVLDVRAGHSATSPVDDFLIRNLPYYFSVVYSVFIIVAVTGLRLSRPEAIDYMHHMEPEILRLYNVFKKYGVFLIIIVLSFVSEYFYQGKDYYLLLAMWWPVAALWMHFSVIANAKSALNGKYVELVESGTRFGLIFGILSVFVPFIECFILMVIERVHS